MSDARLIYIVDDAVDYRYLLKQLFNRELSTYPVRFFASGSDLLQELPQLREKPSLILLDHHMPVLDGYQTLLHLRQHSAYRKIPVVMMSADATIHEINGCYEAGANSFLIKKLEFHSLKEMLSTVCQYWLTFNQEPVEG